MQQKFKLSVFDSNHIMPDVPLPEQLTNYTIDKSVLDTVVDIEANDPARAIMMYLHGHLFKFKEVLTHTITIIVVEKPKNKIDFIILITEDYLSQCDPERVCNRVLH